MGRTMKIRSPPITVVSSSSLQPLFCDVQLSDDNSARGGLLLVNNHIDHRSSPTSSANKKIWRYNLPVFIIIFCCLWLLPSGIFCLSTSSLSSSSNFPFNKAEDNINRNNQNHHIIKNVAIVGGTHGNEYTGVWVIKAMEKNRQKFQKDYPTLSIQTLVGNPEAHLANKRFIDSDLNREFTESKLVLKLLRQQQQNNIEMDDDDDEEQSIESLRAQEINQLLGPKFCSSDDDDDDDYVTTTTPRKRRRKRRITSSYKSDLIVDLHSTTSNMGITIIIPEGDAIMGQAAAYVMYKINNNNNNNNVDDDDSDNSTSVDDSGNGSVSCRCLMHSIPSKDQRPNLSSVAKHGFTIEVGPVSQGVLRHDAVENTELAIKYLLEFLEIRNNNINNNNNNSEEDRLLWMTGLGLESYYKEGHVPCYRTAKSSNPEYSMSGKISWPTDPDNPNFPLVLVHKSIQDGDFTHLLKKGDPLFVKLDGSIINYDGSFGDEVYLIFINEGGYYYKSSGTGIGVAVKASYDIQTGMIIPSK